MRGVATLLTFVAAGGLSACDEDPTSEPVAPEEAPVSAPAADGLSQEDARMARDLVAYFRRNASGAGWYEAIERFTVRDGVITVRTSLALTGRLEGEAMEICDLIQGADVADFTPHTVAGQGQAVVCPHRKD